MLFRHIQPLLLMREPMTRDVRGPAMSVLPLDGDTPDHVARFLVWAMLRVEPATRAARAPAKPDPATDPTKPTDPVKPTDPAKPVDPIVVTAPAREPQLLVEMSPDKGGWTVVSTLSRRATSRTWSPCPTCFDSFGSVWRSREYPPRPTRW